VPLSDDLSEHLDDSLAKLGEHAGRLRDRSTKR
jgi:hypothetical protein